MYKTIVAGGTFDLLHKGHKSFLTQIFNQTDHLILGLTSDNYIANNKDGNIENFETRKKNLEEFLIRYKNKFEILQIDDIYGPLLDSNLNPDAIAVTDQTKDSVEKINEKRKALGLPVLESIIIPMDLAKDGQDISSTRIRNGEINREGKLYFPKEWEGKTFVMPENLREELSKPFGEILHDVRQDLDGSKIITVGDETTKIFNEKNIGQTLSIIDFKIHRERRFDSINDLGFDENVKVYEVNNPSATISSRLFETIGKIFGEKTKSLILINGEDDLAVLPSIIFSPLGFVIYYGQPNEGLVEITVTEDVKEKAFSLLSSFSRQ